MSKWFEPKREDISFSENGKEMHVFFDQDDFGAIYVSLQVEDVRKALAASLLTRQKAEMEEIVEKIYKDWKEEPGRVNFESTELLKNRILATLKDHKKEPKTSCKCGCAITTPHSHLVYGRTCECEKGTREIYERESNTSNW